MRQQQIRRSARRAVPAAPEQDAAVPDRRRGAPDDRTALLLDAIDDALAATVPTT